MTITSIAGHPNGSASSTVCMYMCLSLLCEEVGLQRQGNAVQFFISLVGGTFPSTLVM